MTSASPPSPGRVFGLRGVQVLILDEADRMFDLGFIKDIRYVLRRLPEHDRRLNLLFSATLSHRVLELAYEHMNDPELVRIEPDKMTVDRVTQSIYFPSNDEKFPLLLTLLRDRDPHRTMIFVNTRREAERLRERLQHNGFCLPPACRKKTGRLPAIRRPYSLWRTVHTPVCLACHRHTAGAQNG